MTRLAIDEAAFLGGLPKAPSHYNPQRYPGAARNRRDWVIDRMVDDGYVASGQAAAVDVYTIAPHVGRGGWTWYTGSAAWMQRAGVESILGISLEGDRLCVDPCIPKAWPGFEATLKLGSSRYEIRVENPEGAGHGVVFASVDGVDIEERPPRPPLLDDGATHRLVIRLG